MSFTFTIAKQSYQSIKVALPINYHKWCVNKTEEEKTGTAALLMAISGTTSSGNNILVPTSVEKCRKVPTSADKRRQAPTSADKLRQAPTSALVSKQNKQRKLYNGLRSLLAKQGLN